MLKLLDKPFIDGLLVFEPRHFEDERGYFFENFHLKRYAELGLNENLVQDNVSFSKANVIRGLHYQIPPFGQGKLVSVLKGKVLDVAVDIRKNSPTFGQHFSIELSEKNHFLFWIPQGFAHGFSVLSEDCIFMYKCSNFYDKSSERGIKFNDFELNIDWKLNDQNCIISEKDQELPNWKDIVDFF